MPKKSTSGATYAGNEGIVEDAQGQLFEVNPEKETPDDAVLGDGVKTIEEDKKENEGSEDVSPGNSSKTSSTPIEKTQARSAPKGR